MYQISQQVLQAVVDYLAQQPYNEVHQIINILRSLPAVETGPAHQKGEQSPTPAKPTETAPKAEKTA